MNRKAAREWLIQFFYQMDIRNEFTKELFQVSVNALETPVPENNKLYMEEVIQIFFDNREAVDTIISEHLIDWTIDRMSRVDLAILRVAVIELRFMAGIPVSVTVNEAVDLSKKYGDEESAGFVNGVLGKIAV